MKLHVLNHESWHQLNEDIQKKEGVMAPASLRVYSGLGHGIFEVLRGTSSFLAHKKNVVFVKGYTNAFDFVLPLYFKEAYSVVAPFGRDIVNAKEWVDSLKSETAFVVLAEDHPITGEIFPHADEIDKYLQEKRIFCIRVSFFRHLSEKLEVAPYTVRLCVFGEDCAVAYCGARYRVPPLLASAMPWNKEEIIAAMESCRQSYRTHRELVEKFEAFLPPAYSAWSFTGPRLYDRAVIYSAQLGGLHVLGHLGAKPSRQIATTHACSLGNFEVYRQWWDKAPEPEVLRGMLIIPVSQLEDTQFQQEFSKAAELALSESSWSI